MSTATGRDLRDGLRTIEARVRDLRDERADLVKEMRAAQQAYADVIQSDDPKTNSPEFRKAKAATDRLAQHDATLAAAQEEHVAVLELLAGESDGKPVLAGGREHQAAVEALQSPGMWLASVLETRKADIATLPNDLRFKAAAPGFMTTANGASTIVQSDAMIDLLTPQSVALASGIAVLRMDTTKTRIPRFTELPDAAWIAERAAFPKSAPGIEMVDVEPPKVGLVSPLSVEVFEDLSPLGLAMVQTQILRAVALAYDRGILFGDTGGVNEVQTVTINGAPTGGSFRLTFDGKQTANIAYNADGAAVQAALAALSNLAAGDVAVTGAAGGPYTVTFTGARGSRDVPTLTATHTLTGGTTPSVSVVTTTPGSPGDAPLGIAHHDDIQTVTAPLTSLGAFAAAIAALIGTNAYPGALIINPLDLGTLLQITESSGATESNVPLWKAAITRPNSGAFSLTLPYFGVPIWPTPAAPQGQALLYDPRTVIAVLRREADIAIDPYYGFDTGEVGLRTYLRGDVVVGQAAGAVRIAFEAS